MNRGHGHVFPREDGVRARCGGPAVCNECAKDLNILEHPRFNGLIKERDHYREALEKINGLAHQWVIAEKTADCKHTYSKIAAKVREALYGT